MGTKQILIVEDTQEYSDLLIDRLNALMDPDEFVFNTADTYEAAKKMLDNMGFSTIIVDLQLKDSSGAYDDDGGVKVLKYAHKCNPILKAIVLTGKDNYENLLASLRAHAFDFFVKGKDEYDILLSNLRRACKFYEQENGVHEITAHYLHLQGCALDERWHRCNKTDKIMSIQSAKRAFLAISINSENKIIEQAIKRVWDKIGIKTFTDMDTLGGNKFCDICLNIRTSNYFIAAINTTQCPSVYHELGMAQALGREVIIIVSKSFLDENEKTFPWNIQVFKPVIYDDDTTKMPMTLEIELCEWIKQHMTGIDMSLINNYQQEQNRLLNRP